MNKETREKILIEIGGFNDVVTDLRDAWNDANNTLDNNVKIQSDVLTDFLGIINGFEKEIIFSISF